MNIYMCVCEREGGYGWRKMRYVIYDFIDMDTGDGMYRSGTFMVIISVNDVILVKIRSYDFFS